MTTPLSVHVRSAQPASGAGAAVPVDNAQHDAERELLASLKFEGPTLRLDLLDAAQLAALAGRSPEIWEQVARAMADPSLITSVKLPAAQLNGAQLEALCRGLGHLPRLDSVELHAPANAHGLRFDLTALDASRPWTVRVSPSAAMDIYVNPRTKVVCTGLARATLRKAWVHTMSEGREVSVRTLRNMLYFREPTEFQQAGKTGQQVAIETQRENLNESTVFANHEMSEAWNAPVLESAGIICRHDSTQFVSDRQAHEARKQPAEAERPAKRQRAETKAERFSLQAFSSREGLQRHVPSTTEHQYRKAKGEAMCPSSRVGELLVAQLRELAAGTLPVAPRRFTISDTDHVTAVEVQVRLNEDGELEYPVVFYDPNYTATHQRCVLDEEGLQDLARQPLNLWIRETNSDNKGCTFYSAATDLTDTKGAQISPALVLYEPGDHRIAFEALKVGDAERVRQTMRGGQPFGVEYAMERGHVQAVRVAVQITTTLRASDSAKAQALSGHVGHPLLAGFMGGEGDAVEVFADAVLESQDIAEATALLVLRGVKEHDPRRNAEPTALWRACEADKVPYFDAGLDARRQDAIYKFTAVVASSEMMELPNKGKLLAGEGPRGDGSTAAKVACLNGHAGSAGALFCAILEKSVPGEAAKLLALATTREDPRMCASSRGPTLHEVLHALDWEGGAGNRQWMTRILAALPQSGIDSAEIHALQNEFGPKLAETQTPRMREHPLVGKRVRGADKSAFGVNASGGRLNAIGVVPARGAADAPVLLCRSTMELGEYARFAASTAVDPSPEAARFPYRYEIPSDLLEANPRTY